MPTSASCRVDSGRIAGARPICRAACDPGRRAHAQPPFQCLRRLRAGPPDGRDGERRQAADRRRRGPVHRAIRSVRDEHFDFWRSRAQDARADRDRRAVRLDTRAAPRPVAPADEPRRRNRGPGWRSSATKSVRYRMHLKWEPPTPGHTDWRGREGTASALATRHWPTMTARSARR